MKKKENLLAFVNVFQYNDLKNLLLKEEELKYICNHKLFIERNYCQLKNMPMNIQFSKLNDTQL